MNESIFREYDIRGLVPQELDTDTVKKIAKAFGTMLGAKNLKRIAVGGDVRLHTNEIKDIFIEAINSTGIDVIDIGQLTTPVCYFSPFHLDIDGFVMITASHNPKEYNGFKLGIGKTTLFGSEIQEVRRIAAAGKFLQGQGTREKRDIIPAYMDYLTQRFKLKNPVKMVYDPANAVGAIFGTELFKRVGAEVISINDKVDGNFPSHHPDPTIWENMVELSAKVKETGAKLGIGLDGDGDRIGIIDENGKMIPGDLLTLIFAKDILRELPGAKIIFEVKSTMAMEEEISKAGGKPIMWKVGHSLLKNKMLEEKAPLAGELSGHIFFADKFFGFDDAMYAGLRLLEILDRTGKSVSQLLDGVPSYPGTPEIRCEAENDEEKFRITKAAVEYFTKNFKVIDIDGVRIQFDGGWGLVRASNTQPSIVTRFEAKTPERLEEIKNLVLGKLQEFGKLTVGAKH